MSIASDLLTLLRRPLPQPGDAPPAARGKRQAAEPAGDDVPLSEADLLAAIEAAAAERTRAEGVITEASSRREALLMQPDTDGAILDAGRDIDAAQLALERLDRIEPDLHARLRTLRHDARRARWLVARDRYIQRVAGFAAALDEFDAVHRPVLEAARAELLAEFPDAAEKYVSGDAPRHPSQYVMPPPPLPPPGAAEAYRHGLERMGTLLHDPDPAPLPPVLRQATPDEMGRLFGAGPVDTAHEALLRDRYGKPREGVLAGEA